MQDAELDELLPPGVLRLPLRLGEGDAGAPGRLELDTDLGLALLPGVVRTGAGRMHLPAERARLGRRFGR